MSGRVVENGYGKQNIQIFSIKSLARRVDKVFLAILLDLPKALSLGFTLAVRDIRAKYRQTALGLLWPIIYPVAYSAIFVALLEAKGISGDVAGVPAAVFVFCGLAIFQVWIEELKGQLEVFKKNRDVATKLLVPSETFFYASFFQSIFNLFIRIGLIFFSFFLFGVGIENAWAFIFFGVFCVFSASVIGFLLQPFAVLYRDIGQVVNSLTMGFLLLSAIFYEPTKDVSSVLYSVNLYNPLAVFVNTARDFLIGGEHVLFHAALVWMPSLIGAFILQLILMKIISPIIIERMGN